MNLSSLKVRTKLWLGFGVMAVVVCAMAVAALISLGRANQRFDHYLDSVAKRERQVAAIESAAKARAIAARNLVLVTADDDRRKEHAAVMAAHQAVGREIGRLKQDIDTGEDVTPKDRELFQRLADVETRYGAVAQAIVGLVDAGKRDEAVAKMNAECRPLLESLLSATADFTGYEQERASAERTLASEASNRDLLGLSAATLAAALMAAGLGWVISRAVTRPLTKAISVAEAVAGGDLRDTAEVAGTDELSQLLRALGAMSHNLSGMVVQMRQTADGIATASSEIASGNQDLSNRTELQASALQQTASSMAQMTANVQTSTASSRKAAGLAAQAAEVASQGGDVVSRVIETMSAINGSSKRIEDIIGVIDGIAFQTNILALNAAVEAARAGEQGRGFAVVAAEVRSLAQRSAQAAKEIKQLISHSTATVQTGDALVQEAGRTMTDILSRAREVTSLMNEISAGALEQSSGIEQVNQAVSSIDQGTQQNAALVEQSAAAAESLRLQAQSLTQAIARFKVANGAAATAA